MNPTRCPTVNELPPPRGKTGWPWTVGSPRLPAGMPSGDPWPRISIVTPSYNQTEFIEGTIRSVLLQGYPNLEYIIIDGASTDGSAEIIRKYETWLDHWVSEPDRGQAHAINKGAIKASGEIFGWLNSDDFFMPGALRVFAEMYRKHTQAVAWAGGCYRIKPNGQILSRVIPRHLDRDSLADWWWQGFFHQPSCLFATRAWGELGPLDESLHIAFDLDWWLRLAGLGEFASTTEMLSVATIHEDAKTQARMTEMRTETLSVQMRHGYHDMAKHWLARSLESRFVRSRVKNALAEILMSRARRYSPWSWDGQPRYVQAVLKDWFAEHEHLEDFRRTWADK
jgi:glycosyltransferase involved in cell wall biosynthesis